MALSAIIAGGGIGGLATAAALGQRGWDVTVYERQSELRTVGSGIYTWENGLRVLETLGAYDDATRGAFRGTHFQHRDKHNHVVDDGRLPDGCRLVTVMRSQLLHALHEACKRFGVHVVTRAEVIGATPRGQLQFSEGTVREADLAVGVDGVWSKVRESLNLELSHEVTREGCLRTIVPSVPGDFAPEDAGKYIENWNGMRRFLVTPTSAHQIYLALTCPKDDSDACRIPIDKALWKRDFPHWGHLIDRITEHATWGLYSIIHCSAWSSGRTAILGDAAHAQPPNLGQGGGMAMQNALALAHFMSRAKSRRDIPELLEEWEASERGIVEHCQKWSRLYGEMTYLPDEVRSKAVRGAMEDEWVSAQFFRAANHAPTGWPGQGLNA